jgi:hypothetical protein
MDVEFDDAVHSSKTGICLSVRSEYGGMFVYGHIDDALADLDFLTSEAIIIDTNHFWNQLRGITFPQHQNPSVHGKMLTDKIHDMLEQLVQRLVEDKGLADFAQDRISPVV